MSKKRDSFPVWLLLLVVLVVLAIALYFFAKNEKVKQYSTDLKRRIREKEDAINFLKKERKQLMQIKYELTLKAHKWFKVARVISLMILVGFALICCVVYRMEFWQAIMWIVGIVSIIYYSITLIVQNKLGDFNQTLKMVESYFTEYAYRKGGFKVCMLELIETKISKEEQELNELKNQLLKF